MPKVVDHQARRRELAQALWRVVARGGVGAASVRSVAAESGWSAGALRHYFPDHAGLLAFAMEQVTERATARINALPDGVDVQEALEQIIPLDAERRTEAEIWLAFATHARVTPSLQRLSADVHREIHDLVALLLSQAGLPDETPRLHALIDGLSTQLLLYPELMSAEEARRVLRTHLDQLYVTMSA